MRAYILEINDTKNDCVICNKKNAMIGEKSSTIPGPPNGERWITERMGLSIGSVSENNICTGRLPCTIGNHDRITRASINT